MNISLFPVILPPGLFKSVISLFREIWSWEFQIGYGGHSFSFGDTVIWSTLIGLIVYYFGDNV